MGNLRQKYTSKLLDKLREEIEEKNLHEPNRIRQVDFATQIIEMIDNNMSKEQNALRIIDKFDLRKKYS